MALNCEGKECHVIAINTQKGGVGKSSSAVCISAILGEVYDENVLLIDMDTQGNSTSYSNIPKDNGKDIGTLLANFAVDGELPEIDEILACIRRGSYTKNERIPNTVKWIEKVIEFPYDVLGVYGSELSIFELAVYNRDNFLYSHTEYAFSILKYVVDMIIKECNYTYIIIDTPPSTSVSVINSLYCSDWLIIPLFSDIAALEGIPAVLNRLNELNLYLPNFDVLGVLFQKYNPIRALDKAILEQISYPSFETKIPDVNSKMSKAFAEGIIPVLKTDKAYEKLRTAYIELCKEIIDKINATISENGEINRERGIQVNG